MPTSTAYVYFPDAAYTHQSALQAARQTLHGWVIVDGLLHQDDDDKERKTISLPSPTSSSRSLYLCDYDFLPFEELLGCATSQCSSYVIRKALIRKNHLSHALHAFSLKSASSLKLTPRTWQVDIQFADELDELLLDDLYDLEIDLRANEDGDSKKKQYFILKPAMADRGNGIRLFSSVDELRNIFLEFEEDSDEDQDDEEFDGEGGGPSSNAVMTSQLRHFVIQDYVSTPLLLSPSLPPGSLSAPSAPRKFHLRAYVLCVGGLQVYLYDDMLALFAPLPYLEPGNDDDGSSAPDLRRHLTNTCLHSAGTGPSEENVHLWSDLADTPCASGGNITSPRSKLTPEDIDHIKERSALVVGAAFEAAAKGGTVHWQMWPNAFEVFGVDLMVAWGSADNGEPELNVTLLEVNAQPDFAQTGQRLRSIVDQLFRRTLEVAVLRSGGGEEKQQHVEGGTDAGGEWKKGESRDNMTLCFSEQLSKAW